MRTRITILFMFVMVFLFSGCALDIEQHNKLLTSSDVKSAIKKAGVHLDNCYRIEPEEFALNDIAPSIWEVTRKRDDHVFIYIFDNFEDRRIAAAEFYTDDFRSNLKPFLRPDYYPMCYETKNVLIVYTCKDDVYYPTKTMPRELYLTYLAVNNLKEIKQTVFTGESEYWKGTITLTEYEHILTADGRILTHEEWINAGNPEKLDDSEFRHMIYPRMTYKKADITSIDEINYHIVKPRGGSYSGSDQLLNRFRTVACGGFGSSVHGVTKDDVYVMTVRWNGNEEVMELKAK